MLQSNAFSNFITKPTKVSKTSQTIINHILSNDSESIITRKVLYKISVKYYPLKPLNQLWNLTPVLSVLRLKKIVRKSLHEVN